MVGILRLLVDSLVTLARNDKKGVRLKSHLQYFNVYFCHCER